MCLIITSESHDLRTLCNLQLRLSVRIKKALSGNPEGMKSKETQELVGCTLSDFLSHIDSFFARWSGISWENMTHGSWTMSFCVACREKKQEPCFQYTCLRAAALADTETLLARLDWDWKQAPPWELRVNGHLI